MSRIQLEITVCTKNQESLNFHEEGQLTPVSTEMLQTSGFSDQSFKMAILRILQQGTKNTLQVNEKQKTSTNKSKTQRRIKWKFLKRPAAK